MPRRTAGRIGAGGGTPTETQTRSWNERAVVGDRSQVLVADTQRVVQRLDPVVETAGGDDVTGSHAHARLHLDAAQVRV
jgi:hypothetical protein